MKSQKEIERIAQRCLNNILEYINLPDDKKNRYNYDCTLIGWIEDAARRMYE